MGKIINAIAITLAFCACSAMADPGEFMVSGVLRSSKDGVVIKLVQGVKPASSANEAVGAFTRDVLKQYPGYSLVDAIASPLIRKVEPCGKSTAI